MAGAGRPVAAGSAAFVSPRSPAVTPKRIPPLLPTRRSLDVAPKKVNGNGETMLASLSSVRLSAVPVALMSMKLTEVYAVQVATLVVVMLIVAGTITCGENAAGASVYARFVDQRAELAVRQAVNRQRDVAGVLDLVAVVDLGPVRHGDLVGGRADTGHGADGLVQVDRRGVGRLHRHRRRIGGRYADRCSRLPGCTPSRWRC